MHLYFPKLEVLKGRGWHINHVKPGTIKDLTDDSDDNKRVGAEQAKSFHNR